MMEMTTTFSNLKADGVFLPKRRNKPQQKERIKIMSEIKEEMGLHALFYQQVQISKMMADSFLKTQEGIEQLKVAFQKKEEIKSIHTHRVDALRKIDATKIYIRAALEDYKNSDSLVFYEGENVVRKILELLS